ncbi:MerR family transcriptional regulator, partial [Klebsiella pneumoniae]|uniref:MerR family transcriptional regulator n=1 Tax=Klebsiella pneumoniae TaxID=573 RepID=UPI0038D47D1F
MSAYTVSRLALDAGVSVHIVRDYLLRGLLRPVAYTTGGTVAKLAMRQPFVLFKGLTFQKLCLPGAFR